MSAFSSRKLKSHTQKSLAKLPRSSTNKTCCACTKPPEDTTPAAAPVSTAATPPATTHPDARPPIQKAEPSENEIRLDNYRWHLRQMLARLDEGLELEPRNKGFGPVILQSKLAQTEQMLAAAVWMQWTRKDGTYPCPECLIRDLVRNGAKPFFAWCVVEAWTKETLNSLPTGLCEHHHAEELRKAIK